MKTAIPIYLLLLAVIIVQAVVYYPLLPAVMASHFDAAGAANNWASKQAFFTLEFSIIGLTGALFIGLPWLLRGLRVQKMNVPNPEYWLAPERIGQTYSIISERMAWFGAANLLLMISVMQMVISTNLKRGVNLDSSIFAVVLATYLLFVIIWLISFYRKFAKTDSSL